MSDKWSEKISAFLDGELTTAEREQVEAHLSEHPAERRKLRELKRLGDEIRELPKHSLQHDLSADIVAKLKRLSRNVEPLPVPPQKPVYPVDPASSPTAMNWRSAAALMAALAALVLVAIFVAPVPSEIDDMAELNEATLATEERSSADRDRGDHSEPAPPMAKQLGATEDAETDFARKDMADLRYPDADRENLVAGEPSETDYFEEDKGLARGNPLDDDVQMRTQSLSRAEAAILQQSALTDELTRAGELSDATQSLAMVTAQNRPQLYDRVMVIRVSGQADHELVRREIEGLQMGLAMNAPDRVSSKMENPNISPTPRGVRARQSGDGQETAQDRAIHEADRQGQLELTDGPANSASWSMFTVTGNEAEVGELLRNISGEKLVMVDTPIAGTIAFDGDVAEVLPREQESESSEQADQSEDVAPAPGRAFGADSLATRRLAAQRMTAVPADSSPPLLGAPTLPESEKQQAAGFSTTERTVDQQQSNREASAESADKQGPSKRAEQTETADKATSSSHKQIEDLEKEVVVDPADNQSVEDGRAASAAGQTMTDLFQADQAETGRMVRYLVIIQVDSRSTTPVAPAQAAEGAEDVEADQQND